MSTAVDWKTEIEAVAGPFAGNRKGWLARAARLAGVSARSVKALYYGEWNDPSHAVAMGILSAADRARSEALRKDAIRGAECFEILAGDQNAQDQNFNSKDRNSMLHAACLLRQVAGS